VNQTEIIKVDPAEVEEMRPKVDDICVAATNLRVESAADCEIASGIIAAGTALLEYIDGKFQKPTAAAYVAHKEIKGLWNEMRNPVSVAVTTSKGKVAGYHDQLRRDAETARKLEAKRLAAQDEERRLTAALAAEDRGQNERAENIISAPAPVLSKPLIITPPPPKTAGLSTRPVYSGKIIDLPAFIQWSLDTLSFSEYFILKQNVLDRAIQKMKGDVTIPGVEIEVTTGVSSKKV
jgi:hypothetical protein